MAVLSRFRVVLAAVKGFISPPTRRVLNETHNATGGSMTAQEISVRIEVGFPALRLAPGFA